MINQWKSISLVFSNFVRLNFLTPSYEVYYFKLFLSVQLVSQLGLSKTGKANLSSLIKNYRHLTAIVRPLERPALITGSSVPTMR
jgi:hypothetical protein